MNEQYINQVKWLLQLLPVIEKHKCFALKGGTAINLFVRNMPRLSVDIDLVYLPVSDRDSALAHIERELKTIADEIKTQFPSANNNFSTPKGSKFSNKFVVHRGGVKVKVEVSPVLRGTVHKPINLDVTAQVEEVLGFASAYVVSYEDLFAGKIHAALSRQHPRDLFDIKIMLDNNELNSKLIDTLLVYLISSNRPVSELLQPNFLDIKDIYKSEFKGMTTVDVSLDELNAAREQLVARIHELLDDKQKQFLISFKKGKPDWRLLELNGIDQMPAVNWKPKN
jgi:predicted nucleotidyltransferase component of viral defense system